MYSEIVKFEFFLILIRSERKRVAQNPALKHFFHANHAKKLPGIHFHAKFTQSR